MDQTVSGRRLGSIPTRIVETQGTLDAEKRRKFV